MLGFAALDDDVQRNITRFTIERFLQELAEQLGAPDQWQLDAANSAITAYQRGEFDHALRCISVGEKPPHQRPFPATFKVGELSLRSLWSNFLYPSSDSPAGSGSLFSFTSPGTRPDVHPK